MSDVLFLRKSIVQLCQPQHKRLPGSLPGSRYFHETGLNGLRSMVFAAVTDYRRGPAARYDATLGIARTKSSVASVTYTMNISWEELMCVMKYCLLPNDYSALAPKGDNIF